MRPNPDRGIAIVGGGISGVTTAILLQLLGYRTTLYTQIRPSHEPDVVPDPEFATVHAAASVLPHSVSSPKVSYWTEISQAFFRVLSFPGCCGVRRQIHYEIFEDPIPTLPPYAESVENFQVLTPDELEQAWVPRRPAAQRTYGWRFKAFFCEAPEYVGYLYSLYGEIGGCLLDVPLDGSLPAYLGLEHDIYVNCTGIGAHSFLASGHEDGRLADRPLAPDFEPLIDPFPAKLIRGHYLRVDVKDVLTDDRGNFFSYNYKPSAEVYGTARGDPADVYFYQRADSWILGGSRQEGRIGEDGSWIGDQTVGEMIAFPDSRRPSLGIPSQILKLNSEILKRASKGRLDLERLVQSDPSVVEPGVGYRFVRDSESDSVRIGCSRVTFADAPKYILHNYGHGGSGFTLSWGCAFDVLQLLRRIAAHPDSPYAFAERKRFAVRYDAVRLLLLDLANRLLSRAG